MSAVMLPDGRVHVALQDTSIGSFETTLGPVHPSVMVDPILLGAIEQHVRGIADRAGQIVGAATNADQSLCSRCARTLMRSATGDAQARHAVGSAARGMPVRLGDDQRYAACAAKMGHGITSTRQAVEGLSAQLQAGMTGPLIEQTMTGAEDGNPWNAYYQAGQAGAPMKAGQWTEYKSCACGEPGTGDKPSPLPRSSMVGG